jgi:hypothetical protein
MPQDVNMEVHTNKRKKRDSNLPADTFVDLAWGLFMYKNGQSVKVEKVLYP